ncbi:MAG: murein biosynthesis integral membrane protein MurJ [Candidatus Theseobacter exili]|nr:murein biosynthesis integral membrane protein MurJ [Candidatus Theseobacter exili]
MGKNIVKAMRTLSVSTALSRVLGMIRDILFARYFGTSGVWDAFVIAFTVPNLFRRLFGEGALNAAFVPVFTDELTKRGRNAAWKLANSVITLQGSGLVLLVIIGISFLWGIEYFVPLSSHGKFIIQLTQIMLPYMFFICVLGLFMGILNPLGHFFPPAIAPAVLNIVLIGSLFTFSYWMGPSLEGQVRGVAVGVLLGGVIQLAIQLPALRKEGFRYRFSFFFKDPAVVRIMLLMVPTVAGLAVFQVNVLIDRLLALFLREGAVSVLFYSNRLMQLPLGIFGISIATVALPTLSRHASFEDEDGFCRSLDHSLRLLVSVMVPASLGLIILSRQIIHLLFEWNPAGTFSGAATAWALSFYAIGLTMYAAVRVIIQAFYSHKDMVTPVRAGMICIVVNLTLNLILMWPMKEAGLAFSTAIASTINFVILVKLFKKRVPQFNLGNVFKTFKKIIFSSCIMGVVVFGLLILLSMLFPADSLRFRLIKVLIPISAGIGTYLMCCNLFKVQEIQEIKGSFFKKQIR